MKDERKCTKCNLCFLSPSHIKDVKCRNCANKHKMCSTCCKNSNSGSVYLNFAPKETIKCRKA